PNRLDYQPKTGLCLQNVHLSPTQHQNQRKSGHTVELHEICGLKARLAMEFRLDREAYTEAKTPFINFVLGKHPVRELSR
ncbi:MAG: hypothetical protein PHS32_18525, partial [Rhodoferax sp.]|nr:hypothetical protein [Rhodoferax sp.]